MIHFHREEINTLFNFSININQIYLGVDGNIFANNSQFIKMLKDIYLFYLLKLRAIGINFNYFIKEAKIYKTKYGYNYQRK